MTRLHRIRCYCGRIAWHGTAEPGRTYHAWCVCGQRFELRCPPRAEADQ